MTTKGKYLLQFSEKISDNRHHQFANASRDLKQSNAISSENNMKVSVCVCACMRTSLTPRLHNVSNMRSFKKNSMHGP